MSNSSNQEMNIFDYPLDPDNEGFDFDSKDSKWDNMPKWKKIMLFIALGLGGILTMVILRRINDRRTEEKRMREKIRYFKPTITEGVLSNRTSWEMRDAPLTDEQLDSFMKSQKNI